MKKYIYCIFILCFSILMITDIKVNAQEIKITSPKKTIYVKQRIQLKVTPKEVRSKMKWKSANSKIAVVSKSGVVTGKYPGKVKIYAFKKGNKQVNVFFRVNVKKIKKKSIVVKGKVVEAAYDLNKMVKTYNVFRSRNEIKEFVNSVEKNIDSDFAQRKVGKKLLKYKKNFFNSKTVYLVYIGDDVKGHPKRVNNLKIIQSDKGNIIGNLQINVKRKNPKYNYPDSVIDYFAIFELSNKDANDIQYFKVSRNYY